MKRSKQIDIDNHIITVRELTVVEVRHWLKDLEKIEENSIDLVTEGILEDASLTDVVRMTDLTTADLDDMAPSEIDIVLAACREVNPHFFKLRQRLADATQAIS